MQADDKSINVLFVDDSKERWKRLQQVELDGRGRKPEIRLHWAMDARSAKILLQEHEFHMIMLDHDLSEDPESKAETGLDVAWWIRDHKIKTFKVVTHSLNPAGRANIYHVLNEVQYCVEQFPWGWGQDPRTTYTNLRRFLPPDDWTEGEDVDPPSAPNNCEHY